MEVRIARKFPGNADGAQEEMMRDAVKFARKGLVVVRVSSFLPFSFFIFAHFLNPACSSSKVTPQSMLVSPKNSPSSAPLGSLH